MVLAKVETTFSTVNSEPERIRTAGAPQVRESIFKEITSRENRRRIPPPIFISTFTPMAPKPITSPVPDAWYPTLAAFMLAIGLVVTASFFIYETTSSRKSRSLAKELGAGAVASVFLGFGSLFLLLSSGVYV